MPSLIKDYSRKDGRELSPYWIAVLSVGNKRVWRSTKVRIEPDKALDRKADGSPKSRKDLKDEAMQATRALEQGLKLADQGNLTAANIRRILEGFIHSSDRPSTAPTIESWLNDWIEHSKSSVAESTLLRYKHVRDSFLASLGPKASKPLDMIDTKDFYTFRDDLLHKGLSPQTTDNAVRTILGRPFRLAWKQGRISYDPLSAPRPLKATKVEKGVFTSDELAKVLDVSDLEWRGLILVGLFTGARLMDAACLKWGNVDLENRFIRFTTRKTGNTLLVPLCNGLLDYLKSLEANSPYVFPKLSTLRQNRLSILFSRLMAKAGIDAGLVRKASGVGRSFHARSFHSLRHTFNSLLANAVVSQEIRRKFTGHSSDQMNAIYTHHGLAVLESAIAKLPELPPCTQ